MVDRNGIESDSLVLSPLDFLRPRLFCSTPKIVFLAWLLSCPVFGPDNFALIDLSAIRFSSETHHPVYPLLRTFDRNLSDEI